MLNRVRIEKEIQNIIFMIIAANLSNYFGLFSHLELSNNNLKLD